MVLIYISYTDLEAFIYDNIPGKLLQENGNNKYYNQDNLLQSAQQCLKYIN